MKYMIAGGIFLVLILLFSIWITEIPSAIYRRKKNREMHILLKGLIVLVLTACLFCGGIFAYLSFYTHADESVKESLVSKEQVIVRKLDCGYFFDGYGQDTAFVFYPGEKVEETAYAPLMYSLASQGIDCFLLSVPYHIALFDMDAADAVIQSGKYGYAEWYVGGHSLGGNIASRYAAQHADDLCGLILLAAYPVSQVDDSLILLSIYGSEDQILNMEEYRNAYQYWPENCRETVISGGNHSQFGSYETQKNDGTATISAKLQQRLSAEVIRLCIVEGR